MRAANVHPIVSFSAFTLPVVLALLGPLQPIARATEACRLHPLAIPARLLDGAEPGALLPDVFEGRGPGQFGWLSWSGSPSTRLLESSLDDDGDDHTYVNPDHPGDHELDPGDWVCAKPGVSNGHNVRTALHRLRDRDVVVPVWDQCRGAGEKAAYRVCGFARVRLLDFRLPGRNCIAVRFLGHHSCPRRNQPPCVDAGSDQSIDWGAPATLAGQVRDDGRPFGQLTIEWAAGDGPGEVSFAQPAQANTTATFSEPGVYRLVLTASDGVLDACDEVAITVSDANRAPVAIPSIVTLAEDTTVGIALAAADPDDDELTYHLLEGPNHGRLSGEPPQLQYAPDPDFNGADSFTFLVRDHTLESAPAQVTLEIQAVNDPPEAADVALSTPEDTAVPVLLSGSDTEGTGLTYAIVTPPAHGGLTQATGDASGAGWVYQPDPDFHGADHFTYQVSDGELASGVASVTVEVLAVNDAPVVVTEPSVRVSLPTRSVTLTTEATDVDGDPLSVLWQAVEGPGPVEFSNPQSLETTVGVETPGRYQLRCAVSDGQATAEAVVELMVNDPPHVLAGTGRIAGVGEVLDLRGWVADDGLPGDPIAVRWTTAAGPAPARFSDPSQTNCAVVFDLPGLHVLDLTAADGLASSSDTVAIQVLGPADNHPPRVAAGPDRRVGGTDTVQLDGEVSDDGLPLHAPLSVRWELLEGPGPVQWVDALSGRTRAQFVAPGRYQLRLSASDTALTASDEVVLEVYPDNQPPEVDAGPEAVIDVPDPAVLARQWAQPVSPGTDLAASLLTVDHWNTTIGLPGFDAALSYNGLAGSGTNVFAAGYFHHAGTVEAWGSARWDGQAWHPLYDPRPAPYPEIQGAQINFAVNECNGADFCNEFLLAIGARGPEAYVAGSLKELADPTDGFFDLTARWTGDQWESWGFKHSGNHVRVFATTPDAVYVGGHFAFQPAEVSPLDYPLLPWSYGIARWDGTQWSALGSGIVHLTDTPNSADPALHNYGAYITAIAPAPDGRVFAGGQFVMDTPTGRAQHVACWNGTDWEPLGSGLTGTGRNFVVMALALAADGSLFVGGNFTAAGGVPARHLARWDGVRWHAVGTAANHGASHTVNALAVHGRDLYVGGEFYEAGGWPCARIARWNGSTWSPLGTRTAYGVAGNVYALLATDRGILVGGDFSSVAGQPARNIALWEFAQPLPNTVRLAGRVTDDARPQGALLSAWWEAVSGPGPVEWVDPDAAQTLATFDQPGTYVLRLAASDTEWTTTDDTVITVRANAPPLVDAGPDRVAGLGEPVQLAGVVTDDDRPASGAVFTRWELLQGPGTVGFSDPTLPVTSAQFGLAGTYLLRLSANDGQFTQSDDVTVTLQPANLPPGAHAGHDFYGGRTGQPTTLSGQMWDDGRPTGSLHGLWSLLQGPAPVAFADATQPVTTAIFPVPGNYYLRFTATDGELSASGDVRFLVSTSTNPPMPDPDPNTAPEVDVGPDTTAVTSQPLDLLGAITDDGLPANHITAIWSVLLGPGRVYFDPADQPTTRAWFAVPGSYLLRLTATDGRRSTYDDLAIQVVTPTNQPPLVSAGPPLDLTRPDVAHLHGTVLDDGLPTGATVTCQWTRWDGPGQVTFLPTPTNAVATATFSAPGTYVLRLAASDGAQTATADVTVLVRDGVNQPPTVSTGPEMLASLGAVTPLSGTADDDGLPSGALQVHWELLSGPAPATLFTLDHAGYAVFPAPGWYALRLRASDGEFEASAPLQIRVLDHTSPPEVDLVSDTSPWTITAPTDLVGTAASPILDHWELAIRRMPPTEPSVSGTDAPDDAACAWRSVASGHESVNLARLGRLDPTTLPNGLYELQLTATDLLGQSRATHRPLILDGLLKLGAFRLQCLDLDRPIAGLPLQIVRNYDSQAAAAGLIGDFGAGWSLDLHSVRVQKTGPLGRDWVQQDHGGFYSLEPAAPHLVTLTFPGNRVLRFLAQPDPMVQFGYPIEWAGFTFTNLPGTFGTLEIVGPTEAILDGFHGPVDLLDLETYQLFDATRFRFTTPDGTVCVVDEYAGLVELTDRNGAGLRFDADGLVHTTGPGFDILRDDAGRITSIADPAGASVLYAYDTAGNLTEVIDRAAARTRFVYDDAHRLLAITNALGQVTVRNTYDTAGRLVGQTDPDGHAVQFVHDPDLRRTVALDRLGQPTTTECDPHGNVLTLTDALGHTTRFTYDHHDHCLSETDPLGRTRRFAYDDAGRCLESTDPLGHITRFAYDVTGRLLERVDAAGHTTRYRYDPQGNLATYEDPSGHATFARENGLLRAVTNTLGHHLELEQNAQGQLTRLTDASGRISRYTHDPLGRLVSVAVSRETATGPETFESRLAYDAAGRLTNTVRADGSTVSIERNAVGQPMRFIDPLGRVTTLQYDAQGRTSQVAWPDATAASVSRDAEGRVLAFTNALGQVTRYTRDPLGRLTAIQRTDGAAEQFEYDAAGQLVAVTDPRGAVTRWTYDLNGRISARTDALGQSTTMEYDVVGNLVAVRSPLGHVTRFEYDASRRSTQRIDADETTRRFTYTAAGQIASVTDPSGHTTTYGYDPQGRWTAVTNALGHVTRYTYDGLGTLAALTDANGHQTRFLTSPAERTASRILPGGQSESLTWDAAGNLLSRTDANGDTTTFVYDLANRLLRKQPDPRRAEPSVSFEYDGLGRRIAMTDGTGRTTWDYDPAGRVIRKANALGALQYTYDAADNLLTLASETAAGVQVAYQYDTLNRLAAVVDPLSGGFGYHYDADGRLSALAQPNRLDRQFARDALGRITNLVAQTAAGPRVTFHDTYGPAGRRDTTQGEFFSTTGPVTHAQSYGYDPLGRLIAESGTSSSEPQPWTLAYAYDAVGNRLQRLSDLPSLPSQTLDYDPNDRLTDWTYDAHGNPTQSTAPDPISHLPSPVSCRYDFEHRLIRHESTLDGQPRVVELVYDGLGTLVARRLTTPAGTITTGFLVDDRNPSGRSQVVEQWLLAEAPDGTSKIVEVGTFGFEPLATRQRIPAGATTDAWQLRYYGTDTHGSIRYLTDEEGLLTDTWDYDAFGNLLHRTGTTANLRLFAGERFDPDLRFYALRARHYDPDRGRFWTPDPFPGGLGDPGSLHRYVYCQGDPVNHLDPFGLYTLPELSVSQQIGLTLGATLGGYHAWRHNGNQFGWNVVAEGAVGGLAGLTIGSVEAAAWLTLKGQIVASALLALGGTTALQEAQHGYYDLAALDGSLALFGLLGARSFALEHADFNAFPTKRPAPPARSPSQPFEEFIDDFGVNTASRRATDYLHSVGDVPTTRPGLPVYRQGTFSQEDVGWKGNYINGRQWATHNPLTTPEFPRIYGLPAENSGVPDWVVGARVVGPYTTRSAPPGHNNSANPGGATEVLPHDPGYVTVDWFYMPEDGIYGPPPIFRRPVRGN